MKVILKEYQEKLGDVGDVVEVKAGYANNYLIPQGIALLATDGYINQMKLVKKAALKVEAKNIEEANSVGEGLTGLELKFTVRTGEEGKLYGSITNKDLAEKIMAEQRKKVATKRSNPAAKTHPQKHPSDSDPNKDTNDTAPDTSQPSPQKQTIIADIVARDIERLCKQGWK